MQPTVKQQNTERAGYAVVFDSELERRLRRIAWVVDSGLQSRGRQRER